MHFEAGQAPRTKSRNGVRSGCLSGNGGWQVVCIYQKLHSRRALNVVKRITTFPGCARCLEDKRLLNYFIRTIDSVNLMNLAF